MKIGYCLECTPPKIFAAGANVKELKSHVLRDGTVHRRVKTITVEGEPLRLGETAQRYLDRISVKFSGKLVP